MQIVSDFCREYSSEGFAMLYLGKPYFPGRHRRNKRLYAILAERNRVVFFFFWVGGGGGSEEMQAAIEKTLGTGKGEVLRAER